MDGGKGPGLRHFLSGSLATWVRQQVEEGWGGEVSSREGLVLWWAELRSEGGGLKCGAGVQAAVRQEKRTRPRGHFQGFGEEGAMGAQGTGQRG